MRRRFFSLLLLLTVMAPCFFQARAGFAAVAAETVAVNNPSLTLTYSLVNVWSTGFQAAVVLRNNGGQEVVDWRLDFKLRSGIKNIWNAAIVAQNGDTFSVEPVYYTDVIPAGGSINFGFVGIFNESNIIEDIVLIDPAYPLPGGSGGGAPGGITLTEPPVYGGFGPALDPIFNYGSALQMSWYFYEAQRSGPLPRHDGDLPFYDPRTGVKLHDGFFANRIAWRGDSDLADGADVGLDLTGGWHDSGDHVKFGMPMAFSAAFLAWGVLEFEDALRATGQLDRARDNLRWVADYLIRAHAAPDVLYGQVGDGYLDHAVWGSPEVMSQPRPAWKIDPEAPGPDLAAQTSAAMTAMSLVFRADEPLYAETLLQRAVELYDFAQATRAPETATDDSLGRYTDSLAGARDFYLSRSGAKDDLPYAAAWLYLATKEPRFLHDAEADYTRIAGADGKRGWTAVWDDVRYGVYVLMAKIYADPDYAADTLLTESDRRDGYFDYDLHAQNFFNYWLEEGNIPRTPGGLAWLSQWGSGRYTSSTAFLALVYRKHLLGLDVGPTLRENYLKFATEQINYLLGDNPLGMSYLVGFGSNWSQYAHHRASHASTTNNIYDPELPRHVLYGALAGGPDIDDSHTTDRADYILAEACIDANAAFTGLLAGLVDAHGLAGNESDPNFPPPAAPLDEFFPTATLYGSSATSTWVRIDVFNESAYPPRASQGLSYRYFMDLSELYEAGHDVGDLVLQTYLNEGAPLTIKRWKDSAYIFYVEASFAGMEVVPLGTASKRKMTEFVVGVADASLPWNPDNDPSYEGLGIGRAVRSGAIALYDTELPEAEELIWGEEPPEGVLLGDLPPPGGGEPPPVFSAEAFVSDSWATGYCVKFPVTNVSSEPQKPQGITFVLPIEVVISKSWNGVISRRDGDVVDVALPAWVKVLEPGESWAAFGFCAQGTIQPADVTAY